MIVLIENIYTPQNPYDPSRTLKTPHDPWGFSWPLEILQSLCDAPYNSNWQDPSSGPPYSASGPIIHLASLRPIRTPRKLVLVSNLSLTSHTSSIARQGKHQAIHWSIQVCHVIERLCPGTKHKPIFLEAEPLSTYLCLSACPPARPKFVGSKLYSPNLCLGKYNIGHGVNVVLCFVCSCHGQYPLVWTLTSGNTISAHRTDGSTPTTSAS